MSIVRIVYNQGEANEYVFPYAFHIIDPEPGMKATVIRGTRGDGSIVIPGGKKSQEIKIRGKIIEDTGYDAITSKMNEMRTKITTNSATLKMQHYNGSWVSDWEFQVQRIAEIRFPQSLRTEDNPQEYEVVFLVLTY